MELKNYKPKISNRNSIFSKKIEELIQKYSIIGVVDINSLPAPQFQKIRGTLKKHTEILIVKKKLIKLAIEKAKGKFNGIENLLNYTKNGIIGLIFTNQNPFSLFKEAKKSKSAAPIKSGQVAPNDIIVPSGPTSFAPGPILGELGSVKIKAGVNAGKIEIKEDSLVAKEGDEISPVLAGLLTRLGIEPMEVGLNILAVYENGMVFDKKVLDIDEKKIIKDIEDMSKETLSLALGLKYMSKETINIFLSKEAKDSFALAFGIDYLSKDTIKNLLSKANNQMVGVSNNLSQEFRPAGESAPVLTENSVSNEGSSNNNEEKKNEGKEEKTNEVDMGSFF